MSERRLVTLALFVATFLVSLDTAIVATAMPTVVGEIHGSQLYAWVFSSYLLASTVTVPIYGKLADVIGRKPVFMIAIVIFLLGSVLCGQAQTMEQLIAFRVVQGLGAGGLLPINQTILGDIYPLAERARITGLFSTIWGISGLLGPAIGGFLTEHVSWRWVFYVNFPLCLLSLLLIWLFLHERIPHRQHRIDYLGAVLLATAVTTLLLGLQLAGTGATQVVLYAAAAILVPLFLWRERRAAEPLLDLSLFGLRAISVGTLGGGLVGFLLAGQTAFVPPFVQGVLGATPTVAGFVLAGTSVGWPFASTIGGRMLLRTGFRVPAVIGGVVLTLGFGLLYFDTGGSLWYTTLVQAVIGVGFGFYSVTTLLAAQSAVGWDRRGVVTSATQFSRNIGGTIGVSIAGAIFAMGVSAAARGGFDANQLLSPAAAEQLAPQVLDALREVLGDSLRSVYALFVGISVVSILVACFLPGGRPVTVRSAPGEPA